MNECSSSPCLNGGLCVDEVNHFTCSCPDGFTGQHLTSATPVHIHIMSFIV